MMRVEDTRRPSLRSMIMNDYVAFLAVVFPVVMFGIALVIRVVGYLPYIHRAGRRPLGPESISFLLAFGVITLAIGAVILTWKYRRIRHLFQYGLELPGVIVKRWRFRDRGRVYYQYVHGRVEYTMSTAVHFSRTVQALEPERPVRVLIDSAHPERSILKDLYV